MCAKHTHTCLDIQLIRRIAIAASAQQAYNGDDESYQK